MKSGMIGASGGASFRPVAKPLRFPCFFPYLILDLRVFSGCFGRNEFNFDIAIPSA